MFLMGGVSAWMTNALAGIHYDPALPGFSHSVIHPYFVKELDWVKGEYLSVNGRICIDLTVYSKTI